MKPTDQGTVWCTPAANCPACQEQRCHEESERTAHHPYSRHGFSGREWSHPALAQAAQGAKEES